MCHKCPRCGKTSLNIYYADGGDAPTGAWCDGCDAKAIFVGRAMIFLRSLSVIESLTADKRSIKHHERRKIIALAAAHV